MSQYSGGFDQLANVLNRVPAHQPERQAKASRKKQRRARGEVDRSRDHAVYAAPHFPRRPHAHSRPDDIVTERVIRTAIATGSKAHRTVPIMLLAFAVTVALGLGVLLVVR